MKVGTRAGQKLLASEGYKFGVAQNLMNLLLKYLWCLGYIPEPPPCPVDRIILSKTSLRGKLNWTQIQSADEYRKAISAIQKVACQERLSIAQWELREFGRG